MKRFLFLFGFILFLLVDSNAQTITSAGPGAWNNIATWVGGVIPTNANSTAIMVQHNVNIPNSYTATVDQVTVTFGNTLTVDSGGILDLQSSGGTDLALTEDLIIFFIGANLVVNGDFINRSLTALNLGAGLSSTLFGAGSRYEHNIDGGTLPNSSTTWNATSTCDITGVTTGVPGGLNQTFGHLVWNSSGTTGNLSLALTSTTINGDFSILNTNSPGIVTLAGSNGTVDINGDFNVSGSSRFLVTSVSNVTLDVEGDFNFSSTGVLSLLIVQTGTLDFNLGGNFSVTSGTLQAYAVATATSNVTFDGSTAQSFNTSGGTLNNIFNWTIKNASTVNSGTSAFVNGGTFTLEAGGTLGVGSIDGLATGTANGNVRVSGTRTYTSNANIIYNGSAEQNLGNEWDTGGGLNSVAVNLEIDNSNGDGVTNNLTSVTNIVGDLTLTSGSFNIGGSNSMDIQSNFVVASGTIGGSSTSDLTFSGSGSLGTLSMTSGSETLNDIIISRSGDLVIGSSLTTEGDIVLTGNLDFSGQALNIAGTISGTGGLKSNSTSNLSIIGSGFSGAIPFNGSGNQLNDLTLNSTGGATYTWNSAVTINNNVNMTAGTLTHSSGLTMAANSTFIKGAGSIISNSPNAVSSYNVSYTSPGNTSLELPSSSSGLNNLTVAVSGTVSIQSATTVNGSLVLNSGTLDASTNNIEVAGANWTANGGTFTINDANTVTLSETGTISVGGSSIGGTQFGNLTINSGTTVSAPNANLNVSGTWNNQGTFTPNSGTITFNGMSQNIDANGQSFNNVGITAAGIKTLTSALDVNGDLTITSTLAVGTNTINVAGNWDSSTGTFTSANGSVAFDGAAQNITSGVNSFNDLTISGTSVKTLQDALDINGDLIISSTLDVGTNESINIVGNWTNNGTFITGSGKVTFDGGGTSNVLGSATTSFNDIDVTGTTITEIETSHNLTGTLTLVGASSSFDADGSSGSGVFTLLSSADDPTVDGNIAALTTPANLTGDFTVQRYMSAEGGVWRYISAPVTGQDIADWQTQFPITGSFTGADDLGGANLPSVYIYDETENVLGGVNDGWLAYPVTINTETINAGVGYSAFMRASGGQITIDQRGPVNTGNFDYTVAGNLTYTSTGSAADDGWNLLGNPYPSAIDWDLMWTNEVGSNLDATISIRDNADGVFATYNANTNSGANGGTKNIAIGQGFWVHATGTPSLTLNESEKTIDSHEFFKTTEPENFMRIALSDGTHKDETLIHFFEDALPGKDKYDAHKLQNDIFNLSSLMDDGTDLVINAIGSIACDSEVNLNLTNINPGNYTLDFSELSSFNEVVTVYLTDNNNGSFELVADGYQYSFSVTADSTTFGKNRFKVSFDKPDLNPDLIIVGSEVCLTDEASITINDSEIGVYYSANLNGLGVSDTLAGTGVDLILMVNKEMSIGTHEINISANNGCGSLPLTNLATVEVTDIFAITQVVGDQACTSNTLNLKASGAPEDGTYRWYNLEDDDLPLEETSIGEFTTPSINESKMFYVSAVNSLGCEGERTSVEAVVVNLEIPMVSLDTLEHGVYQLESDYTQGNQWYLYGIEIAGATNSTLLITEPGIYSVLVEQSGCSIVSDDYNYDDLITGISEDLSETGITVAPNPFKTTFEITIPEDKFNLRKTSISIFDINGRIVYSDEKVKNEYNLINLHDLENGIYLINVYDGEIGAQFKLIKE